MDRARIEGEWELRNGLNPVQFAEHIAKLAREEALDVLSQKVDHVGEHIERKKVIIAEIEAELANPEAHQEIDLSKLQHDDNCRYWKDEEFCTCGAVYYEQLQVANSRIVELESKLAKPEAEPFAYTTQEELADLNACLKTKEFRSQLIRAWSLRKRDTDIALYTSPRPMQRLTNEEISDLIDDHWEGDNEVHFINAIMDAMIEKNK